MTKEEIFLAIKKMNQKKYFKSKEEYLKTKKFVNENNIPSWLMDDIKKYYDMEYEINLREVK